MGGLRGSVALCLGGGHEHAPEEVVTECTLVCSHESEWPAPAPIPPGEHDGGCGCIDIDLASVDFLTTLQPAFEGATVLALSAAAPNIGEALSAGPSWRGPPPECDRDHRGAHRLALVRSTRLII